MKLLAATNNANKLREIRSILGPLGLTVLSAADAGGIPEVEENGETFVENAVLKAESAAAATGMTVFAEDSGLEVFALGGEPGVYSARYAGPEATDAERIAKLLGRLAGQADRAARFVCVVALAAPGEVLGTATGEVRGTITLAPAGNSGFGYDPVFMPEGSDRTFAQMPAAAKDAISHRGRALRNAVNSGLFNPLTA